jgi:hypothetical protein
LARAKGESQVKEVFAPHKKGVITHLVEDGLSIFAVWK